MSVRPCPHCRNQAARLLDHSSAGADVWYFRCERCGHVFAVRKNNPTAAPWTVVPGKTEPEGAEG